MQYRTSSLTFRYRLFESAAPVENPDMDAHMAEWANAGWRLLTVTQVTRDGGEYIESTYTLFWSLDRAVS